MRRLCTVVFALAAGSSALAANGLAVPPHVEPPGTPRLHDHLLAAYRYPLVLLRLTPVSQRPAGPGWTIEAPSRLALDALVLATVTCVVPKLPRPTRRAVAVLPAIRLAPPQWRAWIALAPPRAALLATT
ncbi:MAG TPA: hypothetical protein VGT60_09680 [Candidatus Limnocylindria bacterium]|nr:hypothetical protein [Candidatus Limnocylindria bacterium]